MRVVKPIAPIRMKWSVIDSDTLNEFVRVVAKSAATIELGTHFNQLSKAFEKLEERIKLTGTTLGRSVASNIRIVTQMKTLFSMDTPQY